MKEYILSLGVGEVGFSKLEKTDFFADTYAITIVVPLSRAIINTITDKPTHTYFHHYRTVNAFIDQVTLKIGMYIQNQGYDYIPIAASQSVGGYSSVFSHKIGGVKSGLGNIGKSTLFISNKFGPAVRLGTVLTNMPLDVEDISPKYICGSCNKCVRMCPANAIYGDGEIDRKACSDYMKEHFLHIGRGAVCGICIKECEKNRS